MQRAFQALNTIIMIVFSLKILHITATVFKFTCSTTFFIQYFCISLKFYYELKKQYFNSKVWI